MNTLKNKAKTSVSPLLVQQFKRCFSVSEKFHSIYSQEVEKLKKHQ